MEIKLPIPGVRDTKFQPGHVYHDTVNGQTYMAGTGDGHMFLVNVQTGMLRRSLDVKDPFEGNPENFIDITKNVILCNRP